MRQQIQLFHEPGSIQIPGATYLSEFVTATEEADLLQHIEKGVWTHEFARRRQHYGMGYGQAEAARLNELPSWIEALGRRLVALRLFTAMPAQALVNEYLPGQGISAHKDYKPFDQVASLSLASGCLMEFAHPLTGTSKSIWLEPRSLVVLTGEARHEWTHAIRPRRHDLVNGEKRPRQRRLSLTFRTMQRIRE